MSSPLADADGSTGGLGAVNTLPQIKTQIDMTLAVARSCKLYGADAIAYVQGNVQECRVDCVLPVAKEARIPLASVAQDIAGAPGAVGAGASLARPGKQSCPRDSDDAFVQNDTDEEDGIPTRVRIRTALARHVANRGTICVVCRKRSCLPRRLGTGGGLRNDDCGPVRTKVPGQSCHRNHRMGADRTSNPGLELPRSNARVCFAYGSRPSRIRAEGGGV